ncbi:MAG TPA: hypothetical protein VFV15_02295 [Moraxellaceae bacterium]|nr:hypothetical protein [Moraxellaceae bacterium]
MSVKLFKTAALALALGMSGAASAADFSYNYVEAGFGELDNDGEALFVNGAFDVAKNIGLVGGLYIGDVDPNVDVTGLEFGAQFHQTLKSNLSFNAGLKLLHIEAEFDHPVFGSQDLDDTGFIANAGLRFQVQPKIQLEGDLKYSSNDLLDDDGFGAQVAGRFYLDNRFSIAPGLAMDTEFDGLFVGLRYDL